MKTIYQIESREDEDTYLVRASSPARAWRWMADNFEATVEQVKIQYRLTKANINEAR